MNISKNQIIGILIVAMSFATAWAVRGQFGHEQGAAWAAGIGGLALVLVSQRKDWYNRVISVTLASAIGWGMGGMISYGQIVGYGRSDNFVNVAYGLFMLFIIGGLYGLLGGGLTGLTLESNGEKKVKWGSLMAEMVAGGLIAYGLLVMQLEILMTPPRSEAWAFCLGAGLALVWYMVRNGYRSSLRVALISMLGAGFGFAFGNFLQIVGNVLEINFNMWNVMEYSIGFFGGSALAYGVFSSKWPDNIESPKPWENRVAFLIAIVIIPLIVYIESLSYNTLLERLKSFAGKEGVVMFSSIFSGLLICSVALFGWVKMEKVRFMFEKSTVWILFVLFLTAYVAISFVVTGAFFGNILSNHVLYVVNIVVVLVLLQKNRNPFFSELKSDVTRRFLYLMVSALILIVLLAVFLINIHGELGGSHDRFPLN